MATKLRQCLFCENQFRSVQGYSGHVASMHDDEVRELLALKEQSGFGAPPPAHAPVFGSPAQPLPQQMSEFDRMEEQMAKSLRMQMMQQQMQTLQMNMMNPHAQQPMNSKVSELKELLSLAAQLQNQAGALDPLGESDTWAPVAQAVADVIPIVTEGYIDYKSGKLPEPNKNEEVMLNKPASITRPIEGNSSRIIQSEPPRSEPYLNT